MNIAEPFIRRPVMTTLVMVSILVFGIMAYRLLPVSDLPNVDFPTLQVSGSLPGGSPETMASSVATPLERQFSTIAGLESMTSSNSLGSTSITLQFALDRDIDAAAQDVQSAIAATLRQLPPDMPSPPSFRKVNPADSPILFIALTSPSLPLYTLDEYAETMLAQQISTVSGVAQVQVFGTQKYAVRVQLDPRALASRGIGIEEVAGAISSANVNLPTGTLQGPDKSFTIQTSGQLLEAETYRPIVVAYRDGQPIRLQELGRVIDGVQNDKSAAWFGNQRGMILAVQRQPGTNTVAVATAVRNLIPTFREQLPASVEMKVLFDRSESIQASVRDIKSTLFITLVLVVLVIFLFLRNISATVIPSLALPMSIVGTFVVLYFFKFNLDNLSLMALTLSVGFVVDDAIVMLENIVRHMEKGEAPLEAALKGSREIGFTILSMTLALAAVFIPILFMGGILGRLFHEFAITITAAILFSGFVSLSLTPMLASRFLRPSAQAHHGRIYAATELGFTKSLKVYERGLRWSIRHRRFTMLYSAAILALTVLLFARIPKGFLPSEDAGRLSGSTETAEGTSFDSMVQHQSAAAAVLAADPNVDEFMSSAGGRGGGATNQGNFFIRLKPKSQRRLTPEQVIERLRPKFAAIPGLRVFLTNPPPIQVGGQQSRSAYQFTLRGTDTDDLYQAAQSFQEKLKTLRGLQDVTSDLQIRTPEIDLDVNRNKAAALGLSVERIETSLATAYSSGQVTTIYAPNN
jgi:HAE1 family hydrophobic/amphiphilic exporter-1